VSCGCRVGRDTHYLIGDRSLDTFTAFVVKDLTNSVIVHDRYQNYDSAQLGTLAHQLCCAPPPM
jgi:transposase